MTAEELAFVEANPNTAGSSTASKATTQSDELVHADLASLLTICAVTRISNANEKEKPRAEGELGGRYGPYAKLCHERAVEMLTRDLAEHSMNKLAQSFKDDPPIPAGSRIVSSASAKESLAVLSGSAFGSA